MTPLAWALCFTALVMPIGKPGPNQLGEGLVLLCVAWTLWRAKKKPDLRSGGIEKYLLAYYAVGVLSAVFGMDPKASLSRLGGEAHLLLAFFTFAAAFKEERPSLALPALALGFIGAALLGISQPIRFFLTHESVMMSRGLVHHITYGEMLCFALAGGLSACVFPEALPKRVTRRHVQAWLALLLVALMLSQARGPWLAFVVMLGLMTFLRRELLPVVGGIAAGGLVMALAAEPFLERLMSITDTGQHANAVRLELWKMAWRMFRDHPILGVGPSNFGTLFHVYYPGQLGEVETWTQVHNIYLHQLAERGLVGLAMFLTLFGMMSVQAWRSFRARPGFWTFWRVGVVTSLWVMNLTQNSFHTASIWMLLVFLWNWCERQAEA